MAEIKELEGTHNLSDLNLSDQHATVTIDIIN